MFPKVSTQTQRWGGAKAGRNGMLQEQVATTLPSLGRDPIEDRDLIHSPAVHCNSGGGGPFEPV